jgi:DNA ligase (NAD+)
MMIEELVMTQETVTQETAAKINWKKMTLKERKATFLRARDSYYNSDKPIMSDADFDDLEDAIREADPQWKGLFAAGAKVKKLKAKLPIPIFSLDKTKPHTVEKWLDAHRQETIVISDKVDGSAMEIVYTDGFPTHAYTRGNGIIGGDVSYIIPHLKIPKRVGKQSFIVRSEAVFSAAAFSKYKQEFDAARNAASGILNRTDIHPAARDMSVVVLQVLQPNQKPSKGLAWAKSAGFTVVPHRVFKGTELTAEKLSKLMASRKAKSKWKLDGMVLTLDNVNRLPRTNNPDWAVAFKENINVEALPIGTVEHVEWEASSHGYLKPTAVYSPVTWDDSKLTRATAFNARFVELNGIGPGAQIKIVRSGDVIPKIEEVVKKAKAQMPDPRKYGGFVWSKNRVDLVLTKPKENEDVRVRVITRFMTEVGVDFMKEGTVRKLYGAGFTNISKIMRATPADFMRMSNVKEKTAEKLHTAIHRILDKGIPIVKLMDASGTFPRGLGSTRFQQIADRWNMKKVLAVAESNPDKLRAALMKIGGWSDTTVDGFLKGAPQFNKWLTITKLKPIYAKEKAPKAKTQKLAGVGATWTGYRNADEEAIVKENGGTVEKFGSKTTHLLYRPGGKESSKLDKARVEGLPVLTWDQFAKKMRL